jgi:hypothetical protein
MTTSLLPSSSLLQVERRKNRVTTASLLLSPCSQQKTEGKKKATTHLCHRFLCFKQKQKNERRR